VTIDPLDGTSTLVKILEHGLRLTPFKASVMIGLQVDGVAVASYICDLATLIVYVRGAFSQRIMALHPNGYAEDLADRFRSWTLTRTALLRHGARVPVSGLYSKLADSFRDIVTGSDSFGLAIVGVAAGTFDAVVRPGGGNWTPWDDTPVNALCQMKGESGLAIFELRDRGLVEIRPPKGLAEITHFERDLLYIDRHYVEGLTRSGLPVRQL